MEREAIHIFYMFEVGSTVTNALEHIDVGTLGTTSHAAPLENVEKTRRDPLQIT